MTMRLAGTVDERGGRFRARIRVDGERITIGTFATREEAESALALFVEKHRAGAPVAGMSLRSWGSRWLDARELDGVHRDVTNERSVWRARVETAAFSELPLLAVTTKDIRDWVALQVRTPGRRGKPPARQTVVNALNLLRSAFEGACEASLLDRNPAREVRVPRVARKSIPWGVALCR